MSEKDASQNYRSALGAAQQVADHSAAITDNLKHQQRHINGTLLEQTEESVGALHMLNDTLPLWQRLGELTKRDIPYEPFDKWQKEAWELIHPAQKDFFSGEASHLHEGAAKVKEAREAYEETRDELYQDVERQQKHVERKTERLSESKSKTKSARSNRSGDVAGAFLDSYKVVGPMAFLGGCFSGGDFGTAFISALIVPLVIGWPLLYVLYESSSNSRNELKSAQAKESESERKLEEAKSSLEELYGYTRAATESGASNADEIMVFSNHEGVFHRAPDRKSDPYVEEGDKVESGDVICMIEVDETRKREIQSNAAGTVTKIFPSRSQSISPEYPLFVIEQKGGSLSEGKNVISVIDRVERSGIEQHVFEEEVCILCGNSEGAARKYGWECKGNVV